MQRLNVGTLGHLLVTVQRSYVTSHGHGWMNHESRDLPDGPESYRHAIPGFLRLSVQTKDKKLPQDAIKRKESNTFM